MKLYSRNIFFFLFKNIEVNNNYTHRLYGMNIFKTSYCFVIWWNQENKSTCPASKTSVQGLGDRMSRILCPELVLIGLFYVFKLMWID